MHEATAKKRAWTGFCCNKSFYSDIHLYESKEGEEYRHLFERTYMKETW